MKTPLPEKSRPVIFTYCRIVTLLYLFFLFAAIHHVSAQCIVPPAVPGCSPAGSSALINNDVVGAGVTRTVTGTSSFSNLTMSGGTLIVCGNLTLDAFTFNSGTIYVNPGASVQINTAIALAFGSGCSIYNFGTFTTTGSIVTGSNNIIHNCTAGAIFNVSFNQLIIQGPNTYLVNNGNINTGYLIIQSTNSPGPVCMGNGSTITTNIIINQYANAFNTPVGASCMYVNTQVINSQPVTANSTMYICYIASNVNIIGAPNWGSATVSSSCSSCSIPLPVELVSFSGHCEGGLVYLQWATASEVNSDHFSVQRSTDGVEFEDVVFLMAQGNSNEIAAYQFVDDVRQVASSTIYYRLVQADISGDHMYMPLVAVYCEREEINIYPTITTDGVITVQAMSGLESVILFDAGGKKIETFFCNGETSRSFYLERFSKGLYVLLIRTSAGKVFHRKIISG